MIEASEAQRLFREVVPESDYEECKGCHNGSAKCFVVHYLHNDCPCSNCLLKTSCTEYCEKYIACIINIVKANRNKMQLFSISKRGYSMQFECPDGTRVRAAKRLKRWMTPNNRLLFNADGS